MRSRQLCIALLPVFVLAFALAAHADPMDNFTFIGGGATIDFSLPASTTEPCCSYTGDFNFQSVSGTVNGSDELIQISFITGRGCAVCDSIVLSYPSSYWTMYLPDLYGITYSGIYPDGLETLTFIPGDYMSNTSGSPPPFASFEIRITPEAAATPEPATIFSLITAALALPVLKRPRVVTS